VLRCGWWRENLFCTLEEIDAPPLTPEILSAQPKSETSVALEWRAADASIRFQVHRSLANGSFEIIADNVAKASYRDEGLVEGETYLYTVKALNADRLPSPPSKVATVSLAYRTAFVAAPTQQDPGNGGACVVQIIKAYDATQPHDQNNLMLVSGNVLRLTLRGPASLELDQIYISQVAMPTGLNPAPAPWDSAPDLTPVGRKVNFTNGAVQTLPSVAYRFDPTRDFIVSFDISNAPGLGDLSYALEAGPTAYFRPGAEAGIPGGNRSADFQPRMDRLYLVERIEVL